MSGRGWMSAGGTTSSSISGLISLDHDESLNTPLSDRPNNFIKQSLDATSETQLSPYSEEETNKSTHMDALSCTRQALTPGGSTIYCTPNGCWSLVDLELSDNTYVDLELKDGDDDVKVEFKNSRLSLFREDSDNIYTEKTGY